MTAYQEPLNPKPTKARRDEPGVGDDYIHWLEPEDSDRAERRRRYAARQSVGFEPHFRDFN